MPAYAPVPAFATRQAYPRTFVIIIGGHAALIAAVMLVKMDLSASIVPTVTEVELIPEPKEPPPAPPEPQPIPQPGQSMIDKPVAIVPIPSDSGPVIDITPVPVPNPGPIIGPEPIPQPRVDFNPKLAPVRTGPRFATPDSQVRPPYPSHKIRTGEEAALRLRLTIDSRGRVTAVEPVGDVDKAFLAAARSHLIDQWRYQPATEDGRAIASTTVITLKFQLDD